MRKTKPKISYDKESRVMSIELSKTRSVDSDIQGNTVIDYGKKGNIARINFYEFSFDDFKNSVKAVRSFARRSEISFSTR